MDKKYECSECEFTTTYEDELCEDCGGCADCCACIHNEDDMYIGREGQE